MTVQLCLPGQGKLMYDDDNETIARSWLVLEKLY